MSKGTVKTEIDLKEILEELRELSSREDALRMQVRQLSEERHEVSAKLARAEEAVEASTLGGLREPPEELAEQASELEKKLSEIDGQLAKIGEEIEEIGHRRVELLKKALPQAWRTVQEARGRAFDPELRREALEGVRRALEPFAKAQDELREAEEVLDRLLAHSGRVDTRAPSLLKTTLTERYGALPSRPSSKDLRILQRIATLAEEVGQ